MTPKQTGNFIYRKLRGSSCDVFPVNPSATEVEGVRCYPNLASVPGVIDGVVAVTHPRNALEVVNQCRNAMSAASGSTVPLAQVASDDEVRACSALGIQCIVGGCPMDVFASLSI